MFKQYMTGVLAVGALFSVAVTMAAETVVATATPETIILANLRQARPDLMFETPRPSPISGLYQVQLTGGPIIYVTPEGDKFIAGELFAIESDGFAQVEDPFLVEKRKSLLSTLNPKETINFKAKGETKAVVYVFTDIDCGYCRLLHSQINSYKENGQNLPGYSDLGIEIRYLAYPRAGIPSDSANKLITAWCSKDKQKALTALKNNEHLMPLSCESNPVAADFKLGGDIGVSSTPNMWLPDGSLMIGYLPPAALAKKLGI